MAPAADDDSVWSPATVVDYSRTSAVNVDGCNVMIALTVVSAGDRKSVGGGNGSLQHAGDAQQYKAANRPFSDDNTPHEATLH